MYNEWLYSEGLFTIKNEKLKGEKASKSEHQISHLLFANNCILFAKANVNGAQRLQRILKTYESSSGLFINFEKSIVFFSINTSLVDRDFIS